MLALKLSWALLQTNDDGETSVDEPGLIDKSTLSVNSSDPGSSNKSPGHRREAVSGARSSSTPSLSC